MATDGINNIAREFHVDYVTEYVNATPETIDAFEEENEEETPTKSSVDENGLPTREDNVPDEITPTHEEQLANDGVINEQTAKKEDAQLVKEPVILNEDGEEYVQDAPEAVEEGEAYKQEAPAEENDLQKKKK